MIDRARLDGVGAQNEKAVHQGVVAAVWPLDLPHFDVFLEDIKNRRNKENAHR